MPFVKPLLFLLHILCLRIPYDIGCPYNCANEFLMMTLLLTLYYHFHCYEYVSNLLLLYYFLN